MEASNSSSSKTEFSFKCKFCKVTTNFNYENGYNYCEGCGHGIEDSEESELVSDIQHTSYVWGEKYTNSNSQQHAGVLKIVDRCKKTKASRGQQDGWRKIKAIAHIYNASKDMIDNAISMFDNMFASIINKSVKLKEAVAAGCLYRVLENYNFAVIKSEFVSSSNLPPKHFYKALKLVENKFNNKISTNKEDLIRAVLKSNVKVEHYDNLISKCVEILNLAERCWLMTGRSQSALIIACSYFAYRLHLIACKDTHWSKVTFDKFCSHFKIFNQKETARKRIKELKTLFLTLAKSDINPMYNGGELWDKDIETHLNYVLLFSEKIINDFLKHKANSSGTSHEEEKESVVLHAFRHPPGASDKICENCSNLTDEQAKELNSLDDKDLISDDEMKEYIRSPEEIVKYEKLKSNIMGNIPVVNKNLESALFGGLPKYSVEAEAIKKLASSMNNENF